MSKLNNLTDFLTSLADTFRSKLGTTAAINPQDFDSKVSEVYSKGKTAQHKAFWDVFQDEGKRTNYSRAFYGEGWTKENFKPCYDMKLTNAYFTFCHSTIYGDLVKILSDLGVTLDLSGAVTVENCFSSTQFTRVGVVDTSSETELKHLFFKSKQLETVDKLILKDDGSQTFDKTFNECYALKNLTVEGKIGGTTLNLRFSPLTRESITSVINAVSTTHKGAKILLKHTAVKNAFGSVTNTEWLALTNTRPNCTIVLS